VPLTVTYIVLDFAPQLRKFDFIEIYMPCRKNYFSWIQIPALHIFDYKYNM